MFEHYWNLNFGSETNWNFYNQFFKSNYFDNFFYLTPNNFDNSGNLELLEKNNFILTKLTKYDAYCLPNNFYE